MYTVFGTMNTQVEGEKEENFREFIQIVFESVTILVPKVFYRKNVPKRHKYCFNLLISIPLEISMGFTDLSML